MHLTAAASVRHGWALIGLVACGPALQAQPLNLAMASLGATGGLNIPSADVLGSGLISLSAGNYQDPHFGKFGTRQNYGIGFGLWPGLELVGRFAEYTDPQHARPGTKDEIGVRDLSVNLKWQLPLQASWLPRLAVGATDLAGGSMNFRSFYGVASDRIGPVDWTLGLARGTPSRQQEGTPRVLDGVFGGVAVQLPVTGASVLAESDGTQRHVGLRYASAPIAMLGDGRLLATVQRSFGAVDWFNRPADQPSFSLQWVMPMGAGVPQRQARGSSLAQAQPLPPLAPAGAAPAAVPGRDWSITLVRALRQAGLDRVQTTLQDGVLTVAYENRSYLHDEADALGLVLGLAAELAPPGASQLQALALKTRLPVLSTRVDLAAYRAFLRDADAGAVRASLVVRPGAQLQGADTRWLAGQADDVAAPLRVEIKPLLSYVLGTEFGALDHSLAVNVRLSASPWAGALVYADWAQRVSTSDNMQPGGVFQGLRLRNGLATLALQQSAWLHPAVFASVGLGQYRHDDLGIEGELIGFMPGSDDTVHLRAQAASRQRGDDNPAHTRAISGSYRWQWRADTWLEGSVHRYTDGSTGPALQLTRWFGDVALNLFGRRGGSRTFVGLELSLPLTPRQGSSLGLVQLSGTPRYVQSYRMRAAARDNRGHLSPSAVRPVDLVLRPEPEWLNAGRLSRAHVADQLQRMREAFYLYGREPLAQVGARP